MAFLFGLILIAFSVWAVGALVSRKSVRAEFSTSLRDDPVRTLAAIGMVAGIDLFMLWILSGATSLGYWGFGGFVFAIICLVVIANTKHGLFG